MVVLHVFSYLDIVGHFFAATIVFWYCDTLSGSVHLWQSCTVASSLKKDRSWNGFVLWGFETWSPRNVEYFMLCNQSKEERVQQMYQDNPRQTLQINRIKQTRTSILQDSSAFRSLLQILRIRKCSIRMVSNAVTNPWYTDVHLQWVGYMIQSLVIVWLLKYWLKSVAFTTSINFDLSQLTFTSRTNGLWCDALLQLCRFVAVALVLRRLGVDNVTFDLRTCSPLPDEPTTCQWSAMVVVCRFKLCLQDVRWHDPNRIKSLRSVPCPVSGRPL